MGRRVTDIGCSGGGRAREKANVKVKVKVKYERSMYPVLDELCRVTHSSWDDAL